MAHEGDEVHIQPLMPDLADDFFDLFDRAFDDNPAWAGCYCEFYEDPCPGDEWDPSSPDFAVQNRAARRRGIEGGTVHGLLAHVGGEAVGWLSAGPRDAYGNLRTYAQAVEPDDPPTGSIMCFVIRPDHRGRGVATALLAAVDDFFLDLGLQVAEAYPRNVPPGADDVGWTSAFYKGSRSMFEQAGYQHHRDVEHWSVLRKPLATAAD